MKVCFISSSLWVYQENFITFLKITNKLGFNEQISSWRTALAGASQFLIWNPLLFLVYVNDLPNKSKPNANLFAEDTSLFAIVKDKNESPNVLNNDLLLISNWPYN